MRTALQLVAALWAATALLSPAAVADGATPYLATIAIERAPGASGPLTGAAVSTLHVTDPQKTAASLALIDGIDVLAFDDATVRIRSAARPTMRAAATGKDRLDTWVIDFEEAAVRALVDESAAPGGGSPTPMQLERFVFEHIADKTYSRSFDLASRVAASGEGDCTEHAVLLAALARAHGYAARVVIGNVVLDLDEGLFAFGHAWTEVFDDGSWRIRDATLPTDDPDLERARYIPLGTLADEGPAYALSLVETMSTMPAKITDVAAAP